ncbi:MAG: PH domain-containing protein [Actinomycetota bacterium]
MSFSNDPIERGDLPVLNESAFHQLDPAHLTASRLGHLVFLGIVVAAATAASITFGSIVPGIVALVLAVFVAISYGRMVLDVRHIGWQVRDHDISYRRGVLVRTVQTLPFVRVQHTRITRSLVQRRFGLSTLHVNTAGPDIAIEGLAAEDAERLKALIIERAGDLDDAVL